MSWQKEESAIFMHWKRRREVKDVRSSRERDAMLDTVDMP